MTVALVVVFERQEHAKYEKYGVPGGSRNTEHSVCPKQQILSSHPRWTHNEVLVYGRRRAAFSVGCGITVKGSRMTQTHAGVTRMPSARWSVDIQRGTDVDRSDTNWILDLLRLVPTGVHDRVHLLLHVCVSRDTAPSRTGNILHNAA